MDVERRRLLGRKRAQPLPRTPRSFELNIGRDDIDQVDLVLNRFDGTLFDSWQGRPRFARSESEGESRSGERLRGECSDLKREPVIRGVPHAEAFAVILNARLLHWLQQPKGDWVRYRQSEGKGF